MAAQDGDIHLKFQMSSMDASVLPLKPDVPARMLGESITDKVFGDTVYRDVFFFLEEPWSSSTAEDNVYDTSDMAEDIDMESRMHNENHPLPTMSQENEIKQEDQANNTLRPKRKMVGAHQLVLSQWPYFKAMFEGEFAESGPGVPRIVVKDVTVEPFICMLRFMYVGRLLRSIGKLALCADEVKSEKDTSLEDVFLVGHRYDVQELCSQVASLILSRLEAVNCIPFLFRTAYKFHELCEPVMKFVAKTCGSQIAKRSIRDSYRDHPDVIDIRGGLFEAHHELYGKEEQRFQIKTPSLCRLCRLFFVYFVGLGNGHA